MALCAWIGAMAQTEKFCIAREGKTATIILDAADRKGVIRAARDLGDDVRKVTGVASQVDLQSPNSAGMLPHERKNLQVSIFVSTIGKNYPGEAYTENHHDRPGNCSWADCCQS